MIGKEETGGELNEQGMIKGVNQSVVSEQYGIPYKTSIESVRKTGLFNVIPKLLCLEQPLRCTLIK